jgi:hypothetical protein
LTRPQPPYTPLYEYQVEGGEVGWRGWRVTISDGSDELGIYAFDERDAVFTEEAAIETALKAENRPEGQPLIVDAVEVRTLVSSPICPN